jgi:hypothetical protein
MRKLLLTVVYYALFAPVAWIVRLFRDPLDRRWEPDRASYWTFEDGVALDEALAQAPAREEDAATAAAYR